MCVVLLAHGKNRHCLALSRDAAGHMPDTNSPRAHRSTLGWRVRAEGRPLPANKTPLLPWVEDPLVVGREGKARQRGAGVREQEAKKSSRQSGRHWETRVHMSWGFQAPGTCAIGLLDSIYRTQLQR